MKGDFSRSTFRRSKHYSNVRLQQGRVLLDADWNEQVDIQASRDQTTTSDVVGVSGAPLHAAGFELSVEGNQLKIGGGRYFVDGILCENDEKVVTFAAKPILTFGDGTRIPVQPDLPGVDLPTEPGSYLAYLDVWERHITALEDPVIRELALGGPDTTTRTKTVWQVKLEQREPGETQRKFGSDWKPKHAEGAAGCLSAQALLSTSSEDLDVHLGDNGYRRLENQLYRVEIHDGGPPYGASRSPESVLPVTDIDSGPPVRVQVEDNRRALQGGQVVELFNEQSKVPEIQAVVTEVDAVDAKTQTRWLTLDKEVLALTPEPTHLQTITFKWSRDNGTVVTGWDGIGGNIITVSDAAKDPVLGFAAGQWVELSDEERTLRGEPGVLVEIVSVQGNDLTVSNSPDGTRPTPGTRPTVRRWDSKGSIPVVVGVWGDLNSEGVQVQFKAGTYRTGDYWTIPARSLNGSVEWPQDDKQNPLLVPPHGIEHHYGPLALLQLDEDRTWTVLRDLRELFAPSAEQNGLHVTGVFLQSTPASATTEQQPSQEQLLEPDTDVPAEELKQGLKLACKTKVDPHVSDTDNKKKRMCFVTIDGPFVRFDNELVAFEPKILSARVTTCGKYICWKPENSDHMQGWLNSILEHPEFPTDRLRARLTLKGSAFEMGFWVTKSELIPKRIGFIPNLQSVQFFENEALPAQNFLHRMTEVVDSAINREQLRLPPGYQKEDKRPDLDKAVREMRHLIADKLPDPRGTISELVCEGRFQPVGAAVADALARGLNVKDPDLRVLYEVKAPPNVLDYVENLLTASRGKRPGMVICEAGEGSGERKLAEELAAKFGHNFRRDTFVKF